MMGSGVRIPLAAPGASCNVRLHRNPIEFALLLLHAVLAHAGAIHLQLLDAPGRLRRFLRGFDAALLAGSRPVFLWFGWGRSAAQGVAAATTARPSATAARCLLIVAMILSCHSGS